MRFRFNIHIWGGGRNGLGEDERLVGFSNYLRHEYLVRIDSNDYWCVITLHYIQQS